MHHRDEIKYTINDVEFTLTPSYDRSRYLLCFNGFLVFSFIEDELNIDSKTFYKLLHDCGAYERGGCMYFNNTKDFESFITTLKLIS